MRKTISFRLLGLGAIPAELRPVLASEGILVADEGMRGWIVSKNVKGPGRRYIYRVRGFSGCLVVTEKRIVCCTYRSRWIDIPVDDPRISLVSVDVPRTGKLAVSLDASAFRDGWSGTMEFRFRTEKAREFYEAMVSIGCITGDNERLKD